MVHQTVHHFLKLHHSGVKTLILSFTKHPLLRWVPSYPPERDLSRPLTVWQTLWISDMWKKWLYLMQKNYNFWVWLCTCSMGTSPWWVWIASRNGFFIWSWKNFIVAAGIWGRNLKCVSIAREFLSSQSENWKKIRVILMCGDTAMFRTLSHKHRS